jgi:hypothetical protein
MLAKQVERIPQLAFYVSVNPDLRAGALGLEVDVQVVPAHLSQRRVQLGVAPATAREIVRVDDAVVELHMPGLVLAHRQFGLAVKFGRDLIDEHRLCLLGRQLHDERVVDLCHAGNIGPASDTCAAVGRDAAGLRAWARPYAPMLATSITKR